MKARSPHYANVAQPERTAELAGTLSQLSPADQAIFARIREQVPGSIADDAVAQATVAARANHITKADDISAAGIFDERLYVMGSNALQLAVFVDLSKQAPPLHQSVQQAQAMDQQQVQQQQVNQQQLNQTGPQGPVMGQP